MRQVGNVFVVGADVELIAGKLNKGLRQNVLVVIGRKGASGRGSRWAMRSRASCTGCPGNGPVPGGAISGICGFAEGVHEIRDDPELEGIGLAGALQLEQNRHSPNRARRRQPIKP